MRKVALALFGLLVSLLSALLISNSAFSQEIAAPTATVVSSPNINIVPAVVGNTLKMDIVVNISDGTAMASDVSIGFRPEDLVYQGWVRGRLTSYYDYPRGVEYGVFYLLTTTEGVDSLSESPVAQVTFQIKPEALEKGQTDFWVITQGYWDTSWQRVELSPYKRVVDLPRPTPMATTVPVVSLTPTRTPRPSPTATPRPTNTPLPTPTQTATPTAVPVPYLELIFPESSRIGQTMEVPIYIRTLGMMGITAAEFQVIFDALSVTGVGFEPISGVEHGVPDWIPGTGTFYVSVGAPRSRFYDGQRIGTLRLGIGNAETDYLSFVARKRNVVLDSGLLRVYSKGTESFLVRIIKPPVGDLDGDGRVTDRDIASWLTALAGDCLVKRCGPDPSGDGLPTIVDLALLMRTYGP